MKIDFVPIEGNSVGKWRNDGCWKWFTCKSFTSMFIVKITVRFDKNSFQSQLNDSFNWMKCMDMFIH
jgi:hypothetical protein